MKVSLNINIPKGQVALNDGSVKQIDNYVLELEDRLIKIHELLKDYADVEPWSMYQITGETLFEIMDLIEDRK